jgi:hypothetical protein
MGELRTFVGAVARKAAPSGGARQAAESAAMQAESVAQCALLRCVVGDPFRSETPAPGVLTPDVVAIAAAAHDEAARPGRQLDALRLSILADALEDAGCPDHAIVAHLRSPGPHARGCWALDVILGKRA